MTTPRNVAGKLRGLGWDMRSGYSINRGELCSPRAFGHGGFTGTVMWIDPQLDLYGCLSFQSPAPDGKGEVNRLAGQIGTIAGAAIDDGSARRTPRLIHQAAACRHPSFQELTCSCATDFASLPGGASG